MLQRSLRTAVRLPFLAVAASLLAATLAPAATAAPIYFVRAGTSISGLDTPPLEDLQATNGVRTIRSFQQFDDEGLIPDADRDYEVESVADLNAGEVKGRIVGQGGPAGGFTNGGASQFAQILDTIVVPGGSGTTIPLRSELSGSWTVTGPPTGGGGLPNGSLVQSRLWVVAGDPFDATFDPDDLFMEGPGIEVLLDETVTTDRFGPFPLVIDDEITLPPGEDRFQFVSQMQLVVSVQDTNTSFSADFFSTGTLDFDFGGLEAQSASGVFPGTVPIPEPSTALLLGTGLAGLAGARRRRARWARAEAPGRGPL